jgi:hypothetical protein
MQFRGSLEVPYFKKLIEGDGVDPTNVDGALAFWIDEPHEISYRGPDGTLHKDTSRLAASTLLWAENGITYRLESDLSMAAATRVAEDLE